MDDRSSLEEEVELLEAIYINELTVIRVNQDRPAGLKILLHPATGEQVDQQYVCLTLEFDIPCDYPMAPPDIMIKNPRGLAEEHINSLRKAMYSLAQERRGNQMLYEIIEAAKESLTQCNVPHGDCIICLEDFSRTDTQFTKTDCYHYFHNHCLVRYIQHSMAELELEREEAVKNKHMDIEEKQVVCPVCREILNCDLESLPCTSALLDDVAAIKLGDDIRQIQQEMAKLFKKQQAKGGIIDVEAEKNKYYLTLTSSVSGKTETVVQHDPQPELDGPIDEVASISCLDSCESKQEPLLQRRDKLSGSKKENNADDHISRDQMDSTTEIHKDAKITNENMEDEKETMREKENTKGSLLDEGFTLDPETSKPDEPKEKKDSASRTGSGRGRNKNHYRRKYDDRRRYDQRREHVDPRTNDSQRKESKRTDDHRNYRDLGYQTRENRQREHRRKPEGTDDRGVSYGQKQVPRKEYQLRIDQGVDPRKMEGSHKPGGGHKQDSKQTTELDTSGRENPRNDTSERRSFRLQADNPRKRYGRRDEVRKTQNSKGNQTRCQDPKEIGSSQGNEEAAVDRRTTHQKEWNGYEDRRSHWKHDKRGEKLDFYRKDRPKEARTAADGKTKPSSEQQTSRFYSERLPLDSTFQHSETKHRERQVRRDRMEGGSTPDSTRDVASGSKNGQTLSVAEDFR